MDLAKVFSMILSLSLMGSIVAVIILLIKVLFKNKFNAKWHYYIWFLLIFRLVMPYAPESSLSIFNLIPSVSPKVELSQSTDFNSNGTIALSNNINELIDIKPNPASSSNINPSSNAKTNLLVDISQSENVISIIWLTGVFILLLYFIAVNIRFLLRVSKQPYCNDEGVIRILKRCKSEMNIERDIPIINDKNLKTPSLCGFIRPKLLIASEIFNQLSDEEKRYVLLHELAHFKRKDILTNYLMVLIQAVYWFNPIIWYAFYKMREDSEVACDAYVLAYLEPDEHKKYGETIINLLKTVAMPYRPSVTTGMVSNKASIRRRIKMITLFKKKAYKWSVVAIALTLLVGCVGLTNSVNSTDKDKNEYVIGGKTIELNKLLEYKDSYVGDNSAVGGILDNLPGNALRKQFKLETTNTPYGIEVDYTNNEYWNSEDVVNKVFLNNATTLFILVKNVDRVKFNLGTPNNLSYSVTREELETLYGRDLSNYAEDKSLWEKEILEMIVASNEKVGNYYQSPDSLSISEGKDITLYFGDDNAEYLIPEIRKITNPTPKSIIQELIKGPTIANLHAVWPENTEVIGVEIKEKIAYVNFGKTLEDSMEHNYGSSAMSRLLLYSLVNTLTLCDKFEIDKIQILIEGQQKIVLGPIAIDEPIRPDLKMIKE